MMEKNDVSRSLREMADLLEVAEANEFEVIAYRNGAQSLTARFKSSGPSIPKSFHATDVKMPTASGSTGRMWSGMSGYSYPQWKGSFYPPEAKTNDLLHHYADHFATVEINNTFYRFPSEKVVQQWLSQTPDGFQFAMKAHRRITHQLRLGPDSEPRIIEFVQRCGQLGTKLGCILFQLPPDFQRDDVRVERLLKLLPAGPRYAVEFRHKSWFEDGVLERLESKNVSIVCGDADDQEPYRRRTADFLYVRLRRQQYTEIEIEDWHTWFETQIAATRDVLAYFKHDEAGEAPQAVAKRWGLASQRQARKVASSAKIRMARRGKTGS